MSGFERTHLIHSLSPFSEAKEGIINPHIDAYLHHYSLHPLTDRSRYKIGCITLDEITTTVQTFRQQKGTISKGSVIIVHGYMDHTGLYSKLISLLLSQQLDVVCYDLSGHGLSNGDPLAVEDFKHYAIQLNQLLKHPDIPLAKPIHLIGQSTGGAIICAQHQLLTKPVPLHGGQRILLAPLIRPAMWRSIKRRFRWLKYVLQRIPRRYSRNSHDAEFLHFLAEQDPLQHKKIPVSWIGAMLAWGDWLEAQPACNNCIHVIQGTGDQTVDWQHNIEIFKQTYPELRIHLIDGARHHLVNESVKYRQQVFQEIERILRESISLKQKKAAK